MTVGEEVQIVVTIRPQSPNVAAVAVACDGVCFLSAGIMPTTAESREHLVELVTAAVRTALQVRL
jgi:hypothetical protein